MDDQKKIMACCVMALFVLAAFLFISGCSEKGAEDQKPDYETEANEAVDTADSAMAEADLSVQFDDMDSAEESVDICAGLPDPLQIAQLEKQLKMEQAIEALYAATDAIEASETELAPARLIKSAQKLTERDLMLIHLRLSYCYVISAVSRLARSGFGPDGVHGTADDLFYIKFTPNTDGDTEVYRLVLTEKGLLLMEAVDPRTNPSGYLKVFFAQGQIVALQAIMDSLMLLLGVEAAVLENLPEGIEAVVPRLDRNKYRHNALFHLEKALEIAERIAPKIAISLRRFDKVVIELFAKQLFDDAKIWGVKIIILPPRYADVNQ